MKRFDDERFVAALQARAESYTLREVAELTGVSAPTLSRLERGTTPDLETFFAVCAWLDMSPNLFMRGAAEDDCLPCKLLEQRLAAIIKIARG